MRQSDIFRIYNLVEDRISIAGNEAYNIAIEVSKHSNLCSTLARNYSMLWYAVEAMAFDDDAFILEFTDLKQTERELLVCIKKHWNLEWRNWEMKD